jgi:Zn-dependent protease
MRVIGSAVRDRRQAPPEGDSRGSRRDSLRAPLLAGGYFSLGEWGGVPVRVHLAVPLSALVLSLSPLGPGLGAGFLTVLLLHVVGHALLAWRNRLPVRLVFLHPLGGECEIASSAASRRPARWVGGWGPAAWAGVGMQLLAMLVVALGATLAPGEPAAAAGWLTALLPLNALIAVFNLLPVPGLDGARGWSLVGRRSPASAPGARRGGAPEVRRALIPLVDASDDQGGEAAGEGQQDPFVRAVIERARRQPRDPGRWN